MRRESLQDENIFVNAKMKQNAEKGEPIYSTIKDKSKVIRATSQEEKYALVTARCRVEYGKYLTCFSYLL